MAASAPHREPDRIQGFDGIRGIGMIGVVMIHSCQDLIHAAAAQHWRGVEYGAADAWAWSIIRFSWSAVDLFFVLSGYLITGILLRTRDDPRYFRNFYMRRILRIFPLYYLIVLARMYLWPIGDYTGVERVAHLTYWSNVWYALEPKSSLMDPVLGVTWSLAIEEHFYLVWPFLVWALSRRALLRTCIGLFFGALLLRTALVYFETPWHFTWLFTLCRVDTVAIGAIVAIVGADRVRGLRWWGLLTAALIIGAVMLGDSNASSPYMQTFGYTGNALYGGCLVVLSLRGGRAAVAASSRLQALARGFERFAASVLSLRFLRFYGRHSYAVYLSHELILEQLTWLFVAGGIGWSVRPIAEHFGFVLPAAIVFMAICVVAAIVVGWLLWHLVENPFLSLRRYFEPRRR